MGKSFLPKKATRSSLDDGPISDLVGLKTSFTLVTTERSGFPLFSVRSYSDRNPHILDPKRGENTCAKSEHHMKNALDTQRERIRSPLYFRIRTKNPLEIKVKSKLYSEPPWNNQRLWCWVQKSRLSYFSARLLCVLCAAPRRTVWTCVQRLDSPRPFRYYMGVERVLKLPQWSAKSKERKKYIFHLLIFFLGVCFLYFRVEYIIFSLHFKYPWL